MPGPFSALVLAAGYGKRLAPLTEEIPKPLLPIGDRPLIVSALEQLSSAGARSLSINVHHLGDKIINTIVGLRQKVHVFEEENILGTAGGIRGASSSFAAPVALVVNGDMYGPLPIEALLEHPGDESVVMAVLQRPASEGTVGFDENGRVVRLRGELFGKEVIGGEYLGVARLARACWARFPSEGCLVADVLLPALRRGELVGGVFVNEELIDVGSMSGYLNANMCWLRQRTPPGGSWLGPRVTGLSSSTPVVDSILGEGTQVAGEGALSRVIALPGARVQAPLTRAIVTPSGRVVHWDREGGA